MLPHRVKSDKSDSRSVSLEFFRSVLDTYSVADRRLWFYSVTRH